MIETHPFGNYIPPNARYLILGSFAGKQAVKDQPYTDESYDWFYGTKGNQFWPILEEVYGVELKNKADRQALFASLDIAMADIIYQCERKEGSNLDANLIIIAYNIEPIEEIVNTHPIEKIYFTSRYVEKRFKKVFKELVTRYPTGSLIALPSPSRRYARMSKEEKVACYREKLPKPSPRQQSWRCKQVRHSLPGESR